MKRTIVVLVLFTMLYNPVIGQSEHHEEPGKLKNRNVIAVFAGNTLIKPSGFNLPTIGVEYIRELNHHMGIGIMAEAELGSHIVQVNEDNGNVTELDRQGAILLIPAVFARVYKGLIVSVGYGVEFESNENLALLKVSLEYKFRMKNERFLVLPTVSWDHTNRFDGWVYGVNFAYLF